MSDLKINNITDRTGDSGPVIAGVSTVSSTGAFTVPVGPTEYRGGRGRVVITGGFSPTLQTSMDRFEIATTGNAVDFGNMSIDNAQSAMVASSTRGVIGGYRTNTPSSDTETNDMKYFTFSSQGGVSDFGDLILTSKMRQGGGNNIRGIFYSGSVPQARNNIEYITIATTGDATDFGDMTANSGGGAGDAGRINVSSPIRGVFGIDAPGTNNTLEFVTIATRGSAAKFGELRGHRMGETCGSSNATRGLFAGGYNSPTTVDSIHYITIASEGNGVDFGNLVNKGNQAASAASSSRMVVMGIAAPAGGIGNTIQYITITTLGNATDFGDLTVNRAQAGANSDVHGGLG